ncbi:Peptidase M23 domain protein [Candidatus Magnetobacterium bavaricum]|uniref:Peptidase M23 domain protein n=1 Tax=Candidatus Magnetobacterium bavaricum TaxID=29290 RepID=A0A0F3H0A4_9BACT|nr:Peptidase M23 domain protein [Candidatus Magnetobacterium bavaricum]
MLIVLLSHSLLYAQEGSNFGFRGYNMPGNQIEMTQQNRDEINAKTRQNVMRLKEEGKLPAYEPRATVLLSLPLKASGALSNYAFYTISAGVDHDTASGSFSDYDCGSRAYDGHRGTDMFSWPFMWKKMDDDELTAVAAAAGTIVYKEDGNYDRNCTTGDAVPNMLSIRHSDGSTTVYAHFKKNSVTTKNVGDAVEEGEYLGVVGSSGSSSGPHLHFEVQDSTEKPIDPFYGNCNKTIPASWWKSQRPYYDPAVFRLMTSTVAYTESSGCGITEITNEKTTFQPGDTVYFNIFYKDLLEAMESAYTIYRPDGTVFKSWEYKYDRAQYLSLAYWYWNYALPTDAPFGKWRFQMVANGQTYEYVFNVGNVSGATLTVKKAGAGSGTVSSSPSGIDCGPTCTASFSSGSPVTLTAAFATGSTLKTWTGCDSTPTATQCVVTMTADRDITVEFTVGGTITKVKNDFNGDGYSDVLWRNTTTGDIYIWLMTGTKITGGDLVVNGIPADWEIKATEDFDGDGKADVLWQNTTVGDVALWLMNGVKITGSSYVSRGIPNNWRIQATADYNGDGKTDLLWQNTTTGDVYIQLMDGKISGGDFATLGLPGDWQTK